MRPAAWLKAVVTSLLCLSASPLWAAEVNFDPGLRWRYQQVDDEVRGDAIAHTLKLRLAASAVFEDTWTIGAEVDAVTAFGPERYSDGVTLRNASPILDPEGEELNRLWLGYNSGAGWSATLGRQRIELDNERHIGSVGFWQNDQSFDALRLVYQPNPQWHIDVSHLSKAHRVVGDDAGAGFSEEDIRFRPGATRPVMQRGNHNHSSQLVNIGYQWAPGQQLSGYWYNLDNQTAAAFSSSTRGLRLTGEYKPSRWKYLYEVEVARQQDAHDSPWEFQANYFKWEVGAQYKSHRWSAAQEYFGSDNGFSFATTLGSNHRFLGWADIFSGYLAPNGLRDSFVTYRGRQGRVRWRAIWHRFDSVRQSQTIGDELDLELAWRPKRHWEFKLVYSRYLADQGQADLPVSQQNLTSWFSSVIYHL